MIKYRGQEVDGCCGVDSNTVIEEREDCPTAPIEKISCSLCGNTYKDTHRQSYPDVIRSWNKQFDTVNNDLDKIDKAIGVFTRALTERMHSKYHEGFTGWDSLDRRVLIDRMFSSSEDVYMDMAKDGKKTCLDVALFAMMIRYDRG